jgi:outer membrane lipoprotein-sorting protein
MRSPSSPGLRFCAAAVLLILGWCGRVPLLGAQELTPEQALRLAEQSVFPDAFVMRATLKTLDSGEESSRMLMDISYKKGVGSRVELLSPARSRGIRFLQKGGALWLFNPQAGTGQAIRLSPKAAFQGSAFSNRDIGDPQYSTEYDVRLLGTEQLDHPQLGSVSVLVLEGTAKSPETAYSRLKLFVRASDHMLLQGEYYAKSGLLFKRQVFTGIRELAGRERPTVIRMVSLDRPNRESVITIERLAEQPDLPDSMFTLTALTR